MADKQHKIYWDACCFLHYINGTPEWVAVLRTVLESASTRPQLTIYTSIVSRVEVAYSIEEQKAGLLSNEELEKIDKLWSAVNIVELCGRIALTARQLIRDARVMKPPLALRSADAIHLATAKHLEVDAIYTTDTKLLNKAYSDLVGIPIRKPDTLYALN